VFAGNSSLFFAALLAYVALGILSVAFSGNTNRARLLQGIGIAAESVRALQFLNFLSIAAITSAAFKIPYLEQLLQRSTGQFLWQAAMSALATARVVPGHL
jgi:hypothetical protein